MKPSDLRIPELDGVRGVAVIMVLVWHFTGSLVRPELGFWVEPVRYVTRLGRTGVDLFFVLSGFLIIGILIDNRRCTGLLRVFYARRIARIVPPYILLIIIYWVCYAFTGPNAAFNTNPSFGQQFTAQIVFGFNWLMALTESPVANGFSVTWSVAIEEQFYMVFPFLVLLTPPRYLGALLLAIGVASVAGRALCYVLLPHATWAPYILTPFRLDGLCAGGLLAIMWRDQGSMARLCLHKRMVLTAFVALAAFLPLLGWAIARDLGWHMYLWGHTYLTALFSVGLMYVLIETTGGGIKALRQPVLSAAGRISYGLYLFHPLFLSLVFVLVGRSELIQVPTDALRAAIALVITIVFCRLSYDLMEKKAIRFGHRLRYEAAMKGSAPARATL